MDLYKQYIADTIKTESRIPSVVANKQALMDALVLFISSAEVLDSLKKHIFYGKPYEEAHLVQHVKNAATAVNNITKSGQKIAVEETSFGDELNPRLFHGIIGIATEAGELCEALVKRLIGEHDDVDLVNLGEELFDADWYKWIIVDELNLDYHKVMDAGFAKLRARYPEAFSAISANNRDLNKERQILESGIQTKQRTVVFS